MLSIRFSFLAAAVCFFHVEPVVSAGIPSNMLGSGTGCVDVLDPPANDVCSGAFNISQNGQWNPDFTEATNDMATYPDGQTIEARKGLWYSITGDGSLYRIKANDDYYPLYYAVFEDNCSELIVKWSGGINSYNTLVLQPEIGKNYLILLSADKNTATFEVEKTPPVYANLDCNNSILLNDSDIIVFKNLDVPFSTIPANQEPNLARVKSLFYHLEGNGKRVVLSVPKYSNCFAQLYEGPCNDLQDLKGFNSYEPWIIETEAGKRYTIRINSYSTYGGFNLIVKFEEPILNDDCADAFPLPESGYQIISNFGSTDDTVQLFYPQYYPKGIWYELEGDGKIHLIRDINAGSLSGAIYEGDCEVVDNFNFINLSSGNSYKWLAREGKRYKILLYSNVETVTNLFFETYTALPHDDCSGAIDMTFTDSTNLDFTKAFNDYLYWGEGENNVFNGLWIKLQGDGNVHDLSLTPSSISNNNNYQVYVFEGACNVLTFIGNNHFSANKNFLLQTEPGKTYYICLSYNLASLLTHQSYPPNYTNLSQESASVIECNDSISIDFSKVPYEKTSSQFTYGRQNLYYKIIGQGQLIKFKVRDPNLYTSINSTVYTLDNDDPGIKKSVAIKQDDQNIQFFGAQGQTYFIQFTAFLSNDSLKTQFQCSDLKQGDLCTNAIDLNGLDTIPYSSDLLTDDLLNFEYYQSTVTNGLWYHLVGDGLHHELKSLINSNSNIYIFEGSCDAYRIFKQQYFGYDQNVFFFAETGKEYFVVVDNYNIVSGEIHHTRHSAPDNDICFNSQMLENDSTYTFRTNFATVDDVTTKYGSQIQANGVWYHTMGSDSIIHVTNLGQEAFQYVLFSGDCNTLIPLNDGTVEAGSNIVWRSQNGIEYFLLLYSNSNNPLSIVKTTESPEVNESCEYASALKCDTVLNIDFSKIPPPTTLNDPCGDIGARTAWFKFSGENKFIEISNVSDSDNNFYQFYLYEGSDCYGSCIGYFSLYNSSGKPTFYADNGKNYFLKVVNYNYPNILALNIKCLEPIANDYCTTAAILPEEGSLDINFYLSTDDVIYNTQFGQYQTYKSAWFNLQGDGKIHVINNPGNQDVSYKIFKGSCEDWTFLGGEHMRNGLSILTEPGVNYFIVLEGGQNIATFSFYTLNAGEINTTCKFSKPLVCESTEVIDLNFWPSTYEGNQQCTPFGYKEWWYHYTASRDELVELSFDGLYTYGYLHAFLYEGDTCPTDVCSTGAEYLNQKFRFRAESGKSYYIRFQTLLSNTITMHTKCTELAPNDLCQNAISIDQPGNYFFSSAAATPDFFTTIGLGYLQFNGVWYELQGNDSIQTIENTGEGRIDYFILIGGCGEERKELRQGYLSPGQSFSWRALQKYHYLVAMNGEELQQSSFAKSSFYNEVNDVCELATSISCGDHIYVDLSSRSSTLNYSDPCGIGVEKSTWFTLEGNGSLISMSMTNPDYYNYLYFGIYESESCPPTACVNIGHLGYGSSNFIFFAEQGKRYYLNINNQNYNGVIDLQVNCLEPLVNDVCENGLEITDDLNIDQNLLLTSSDSISEQDFDIVYQNGAWYKFPGDGKIHTINFSNGYNMQYKILKGVCSDYVVLGGGYTSDSLKFFTETNTEYILYLYGTTNNINLNFTSSEPTYTNTTCNSPTSVSCDEEITVDFGSVPGNLEVNESCSTFGVKTLWYQWKANKTEILTVEQEGLIYYSDVNVQIFEDKKCPADPCSSQSFSLVYNSVRLHVEAGRSYFFKLTSYNNESFRLKFLCSPAAENDICSGAIDITKQGSYPGNFSQSTNDYIQDYYDPNFQNGLWYHIKGDGMIHDITIDPNYCYYAIFEGKCKELKFISNTVSSGLAVISIHAEKKKDYFILIGCSDLSEREFASNVREPKSNDLCVNAERLTCGQSYLIEDVYYSDEIDDLSCVNYFPSAWYSISGKNENITIRSQNSKDFYVYIKNSCDGDGIYCQYIENDGFYATFFADSGVVYYIAIIMPDDEIEGPFEFSIDCSHSYANADLASALPLACGNYLLSLESFPSQNITNSYCFSNNAKNLFYHFTGDGNTLTVHCKALEGVSFTVMDENCYYVKQFNEYDSTLITEVGRKYYLMVNTYFVNNSIQAFSVEFNCKEAADAPSIPTIDEWATLILGLIFLILGVVNYQGHFSKNYRQSSLQNRIDKPKY